MPGKTKRDRVRVSLTIDKDLMERYRAYRTNKGINKGWLALQVEDMIRHILKKRGL